MMKSQAPVTQNVIVFGDRGFTEVIKWNELIRLDLNQIWLVSLQEEEIWT